MRDWKGVYFWAYGTPEVSIFGIILGLLETTKIYRVVQKADTRLVCRVSAFLDHPVVVVVEFFNKALSNAKQTMKMQADNTDTQNEHQCKQSTVLSVKHQQSISSLNNMRLMKFLRMNSEGITERVRPCPRERRCLFSVFRKKKLF